MKAAYRLLAGFLTLVACSACSPGRLIESARLGVEAAAGADGATEAAGRRRDVNLAGVGGDLYLPPAPRAALLMVPGVTPQGRDDPRLIAFAGTLARHGFLVFVPELPGLRTQRVGRDDPRAIAQAGDALATCYRAEGPVRFGVSAISYAVAPAILAALTEPGGERMALILGIGGYHDVTAAITYLTTGYYRSTPGATWRRGMPEPLARWVFALAAARQLPEPRDRELLGMIARARLADPDAEIGQLEAGLGDGGRGVMALVDNGDPDRVPALLAALPDPVRGDIESLDLARYPLDHLSAHLLLIHGRDDPLIPASESQALAAAVPPGHADVFIVGNLSHVAIHPGNIPDSLLLWQAAYRLLAARDGLTVPDAARCAIVKTSESG